MWCNGLAAQRQRRHLTQQQQLAKLSHCDPRHISRREPELRRRLVVGGMKGEFLPSNVCKEDMVVDTFKLEVSHPRR